MFYLFSLFQIWFIVYFYFKVFCFICSHYFKYDLCNTETLYNLYNTCWQSQLRVTKIANAFRIAAVKSITVPKHFANLYPIYQSKIQSISILDRLAMSVACQIWSAFCLSRFLERIKCLSLKSRVCKAKLIPQNETESEISCLYAWLA